MKKNIIKKILISLLIVAQVTIYAGKFDNYIKNVDVTNIKLDNYGNFKDKELAKFLERCFKTGKLSHKAFKDASKLKIKDMVEEKNDAPWATLQLFSVSSFDKKFKFIVKEVKDPKEIERLLEAERNPDFKSFRKSKNIDNRYPIFNFPIAYLSYKHNGKKHLLVIMKKAKGISLMALIKEFKNNPKKKELIRVISKAYFDLGAKISRFYKRFGTLDKTWTHGDLHHGNIFYDIDTRQITLIDNERVVNSLKNKIDIKEDLSFLLMKSLFVTIWTSKDFLKNFSMKKWYSIFLPSFIVGFLSVYPKGEAWTVFLQMKKRITNHDMYTQKGPISKSHKFYMEPILNALEKSEILRLFGSNIDIKKRDSDGKTLLHNAAKSDAYLIHPLIRAQIGVDVRDPHNNTPMHEAAYHNNVEAIQALFDANADINAVDKDGNTPLHKAIYNGSKKAILKLCKLGADKKKKNNEGKSPEMLYNF